MSACRSFVSKTRNVIETLNQTTMKTTVIKILLLLFFANHLSAHTCENEKVKCPLHGSKVTFCVTMSMTTFGGYKDFQKKGAIGDHYEQLINSCSKCHFSGNIDDFKKNWTAEEKEMIKVSLAKYADSKMNDGLECKIAGELKELLKAKSSDIAYCHQVGSYVLRSDKNNVVLRKELQLKASGFLILALANNEFEDKTSIANINYLIAEMNRRTGNFDEAVKYYDIAINNPDKQDWVEKIANEQKELALKKDDNNEI
jgi:hypothetical protein